MTPKTFFALLLKILGIYLVLGSVTVVPEFIITTASTFAQAASYNWQDMAVYALILFLVMAIYYLILKFCVFNTDWIIDKLQLDKGFTEEKIEINIHRSTILSIAVIVTGGLIFVEALPQFCQQFFKFISFKESAGLFGQKPKADWMVYYFVKTLIGYFLMVNNRIVVNFIERKRRE